MLGFSSYSSLISEAKTTGGILHIDHPADRSFRGKRLASQALSTIRGVAIGRTKVSRKIDDKMSFQVIRDQQGRVGVKYKGTGATYNFSNDDIERQHGEKPYLVNSLRAVLAHAHKVLPNKQGEWQGGFMSTPETREEKSGRIGHTPNTVSYSVPKDSPEGKQLARSKVSMTIHSELKGSKRKAVPVSDQSVFRSHPDVHLVNHIVKSDEAKLSPEAKKAVLTHTSAAAELMKGHNYGHLPGHEEHLERYVNSTVDTGEKPNIEGYKAHLQKHWQKEIDKVKTEKAKTAKAAQRDAHMAHIEKNKEAFDRTFEIHHHLQQATNALADNLHQTAHGGVRTEMGGKQSGGEGFVANGVKIVNRREFSKANRERTAILKGKK